MRSFLLFSLFFFALEAYAQPGPIKIFRYFDDFSYLQENDSIEREWYEKLKFIPLGKTANVSFGGEIREMYQYFQHQNFGDVPPFYPTDTEGFLWHRVMAHADLKFGQNWQVFTQLNSTLTFFKENPLSPQIDENQLSLHQAFLRYDFGVTGLFVQPGRQELGKGTEMIIGMREGPNTRLTFDAFLVGLEREKRKIYAFVATPVISEQGVFDDSWINETIWTLYTVNQMGQSYLDLYYFGFYGTERQYGLIAGDENRQTLGARLWKQSKQLNYSLETMYQFGSFNDQSISAYNFSLLGDYQLTKSLSFGAMLNYISGDRDANDNDLNTFNMLYSKPQFGLATPIGATNIQNIKPFVKFSPSPKLNITLSNYWMWRQSTEDGMYTPAATQIRPGNNEDNTLNSRFIGTQSVIEFFYSLNVNTQFFFDYALFTPGGYISDTGKGKTLQYISIKGSFKF